MQSLFQEKGKKSRRTVVKDSMVEILKAFTVNFDDFASRVSCLSFMNPDATAVLLTISLSPISIMINHH